MSYAFVMNVKGLKPDHFQLTEGHELRRATLGEIAQIKSILEGRLALSVTRSLDIFGSVRGLCQLVK